MKILRIHNPIYHSIIYHHGMPGNCFILTDFKQLGGYTLFMSMNYKLLIKKAAP